MTHGSCSEVKRAPCSLPSHQFIASPLLFDRKLSSPTTSIWTSGSPTPSPLPRKSRRGELFLVEDETQARNEYRNCTSTIGRRKRKLEESRGTVCVRTRRKLYRREFIHRLPFNHNTFHPPLPPLLVFQTKQIDRRPRENSSIGYSPL